MLSLKDSVDLPIGWSDALKPGLTQMQKLSLLTQAESCEYLNIKISAYAGQETSPKQTG